MDINKKKRSKRKLFTAFVVVIIACSFFVANRIATKMLNGKGYNSTWEFATEVVKNYWSSRDVKVENVSIEIAEKNIDKLSKHREEALKRNVIINDIDGEYVAAKLEYKGKKMKVKLRLKGHMTDHLQDDKWSFRIKVTDKDYFMGMKRFSVQHPGTRGYFYEWIYHELMKGEDIIALRYEFVNLTVNGRDWGIYAVEENFEEELLENNQRVNGPILRFNPDLYWVHRFNMSQKKSGVDEFASYYSANPVAYREDKILKDSLQTIYYFKAIATIESIRTKKINIEDAFDLKQLANFHAIIDLVGGHNSIDWSDIKYYYNPITAKLEPVAYESFTTLKIKRLCGTYNFTKIDSINENFEDWHQQLFSNEKFFRLYVAALERIAKPAYLDDFFSEKNKTLQHNIKINYKEFPFKKFDKNGYYQNQKIILSFLHSPKGLQAYLKAKNNSNLLLQLGSIESLPIEVYALWNGNKKIAKVASKTILISKQQNKSINFIEQNFVSEPDFILNDSVLKDIEISYSILGSSDTLRTTIYAFSHTDNEFIAEELKNKKENVAEFSFLIRDNINHTIAFKKGKHILSKDLILPANYKVEIQEETRIDLINNAKIISYAPLNFSASEDAPIIVETSDGTGQGIEIISCKSKSQLNYVQLVGFNKVKDTQWKRSGAITFYESDVALNNCTFNDFKSEDAISFIRSTFEIANTMFKNMANDAIDADFSKGSIKNCAFENCLENGIDLLFSDVTLIDLYFDSSKNKAINIKNGSTISAKNIKIKNAFIALSCEDLSTAKIKNIILENCKYGIVAYKNKPGAGHPSIAVSELKQNKVETLTLKERKAFMKIEGKEIEEEIKGVEKLIREAKPK